MILRELLRVQRKMRYELITLDELREIDQIWDEEQDLSRRTLVNIYFEETGKRLPWDELKAPVFDENTCAELERLARENQVPMELLKGMIFKTNKTKFFSNTKVFREALTKTVTQQWLQEAELVNAEEGIINEN